MVKCTVCKNAIPKGTRYYKGPRGGKYHCACGWHVKNKCYAWTK